MAKFTSPLNTIRVASPCSANWDEMIGNDRQRFCGQCKLNVYNLSNMTRQEAENLILNTEGRLCARFYKRSDGSVITKDCPVGWKAVKRRMSKVWTAFASLIVTAVSGIGIVSFMNRASEPEVMGKITVENPQPPENEPIMGDVAVEPQEQPIEMMGGIRNFEPNNNGATMGKIKVSSK